MHHALIPALLVSAACAQTVVDKSQLGNLLPLLESRADELRCEVRSRPPVLDFNSRFRAEFAVRLPLAQLGGRNHHLGLLVRVQPETGGALVYLSARLDDQARHPRRSSAEGPRNPSYETRDRARGGPERPKVFRRIAIQGLLRSDRLLAHRMTVVSARLDARRVSMLGRYSW